jgi:hypothetical protein
MNQETSLTGGGGENNKYKGKDRISLYEHKSLNKNKRQK